MDIPSKENDMQKLGRKVEIVGSFKKQNTKVAET